MRRLVALLTVAALLPTETCQAQLFLGEGSYAQLLAKYDSNHNGLLDDLERAALLAPPKVQQPLAMPAFPLICDGQTAGSGGGASASAEQQSLSLPQVARHVRWRRQQFAEHQPPGDLLRDQANLAEDDLLAEESADGYLSETSPEAPEPRRQNVQFRNVVQYRMLLNETRTRPRSQPFARAATFGPMLGRTKQQMQYMRAVPVEDSCVISRASLYRAGRHCAR